MYFTYERAIRTQHTDIDIALTSSSRVKNQSYITQVMDATVLGMNSIDDYTT